MASFPSPLKFSPPHPPTVLYRRRLLTLFRENRAKTLFLILGQAGQGKSTLVAKEIEMADRPVIWVNIDTTDADPAGFLMNLTIAFQNRWPVLDFNAVINNLGTFVSPEKAQTIYHLWAQSFWGTTPAAIRLVLDALEIVPEKSPTYQLIEALVHTAPDSAQIILISRKRPPIKIERLKLYNKAMIIENESLALNVPETADFLHHTHQLELNKDVTDYIHAYTEGWVVGIILIAQWLKRKQADYPLAELEKRLSQTIPRDIYAYIAEEVFSALGLVDHQFLLQTAFLESLEPELIDKLLKIDNSIVVLNRLSQDYLFIQPFTNASGKLFFRYHQLFKRFLRDTSKKYVSPSTQRNLYLRAAQIIRYIGGELINRGQTARLADLINQFPEKERYQSAWLLLFQSVAIRAKKSAEALEQLCRCRDMFACDGDDAGAIMTLSYLIETSFLVGHSPVDMDQLLKEARALLTTAKQVPIAICAQLWLQIGFATIRGMGDFGKALTTCQTAYLLSKEANNINMQCHSLTLSIMACTHLGEFDHADGLDKKVQVLLPDCATEIKAFHLSAQCLLNVFRGQLTEALTDLHRFETDVEKYGFHHFYTWLISIKSLLYPRIGKVIETEQIVKGWLRSCPEPTFRRAMALLSAAYCAYYKAATVEGATLLEEAAAIFCKGPLRSEFNYQAARKGLAICAYLRHDYISADAIFKETLAYANDINSSILIAENHLFMGLNQYAAKDLRAAADHLRTGFGVITAQRFSQLMILHSDDLACACLLALKLQVLKDLSWVRHLLVKNANKAITGDLGDLITKNHDSPQKNDLKKAHDAIIQATLPRVEITTLGEFKVTLDGKLIAEPQWKGAGTRRFMAVLLAHGNRKIPTDLIMDALWPNSPPQAVQNNFKSALHRLRKVFNPNRERYTRSPYLTVRNDLVGLNRDLCRIDFEQFEQTAQKAFKAKQKADKIELARYALDIYQGDFIPDILYEPTIVRQREHFKALYLKLMDFITAIYLENGELQPAIDFSIQWLAVDPYSDNACRRLMHAYHQMQRSNEALRLYSSFETRLQSDLNLTPDPETRALFQQIAKQV